MGFIFDVLAAPVSLPTRGLMFIFEKIVEQVNNEMLDDSKVRMQLLELQSMLDSGQISEDEFYEAEEELLDHLDAILAAKEGVDLDGDDEDEDDEDEDEDEDEDDEDEDVAVVADDDAMMSIRSGSESRRL